MGDVVRGEQKFSVKQGVSVVADAHKAVGELYDQIAQPDMSLVILFCSPEYDLNVMGRAIKETFPCPILGCTTAGEISSMKGYTQNSLVGASLSSRQLNVHCQIIHPLDRFGMAEAEVLSDTLRSRLHIGRTFSEHNHFGVLLVDGMSMLEEEVIAALHMGLKGLPQIGGSAGDGVNFRKTWIYDDGSFLTNAAVYALFETTLPHRLFRIQHFEPTKERLVITESNVATRTVYEINGMPAAEEYARAVGLEVNQLSPFIFAAHPVMLRIGDEYYVRSIQKAHDDGSLTFFCAIDNGLVLTVAQGVNLIHNLTDSMGSVLEGLPDVRFVLGFDCILRRMEMEQKNLIGEANELLRTIPFIGFSTYGEQFGGIHVNQTLTGVALGGEG